MNNNKFILISTKIAPEVFLKVLEAKEMLKQGKASGITEVTKKVGISRSTYYKYCDFIFPIAENSLGKKITISIILSHESGVLSRFLQIIAKNNGNVLTISQESPVGVSAHASVTFDIGGLSCSFDKLLEILKGINGVEKLNIVSIE
jgi:chorismate mutase